MTTLSVFFCSFLVVMVATPIFIKLAKGFDFLDYPSALKIHTKPTPLLGGLIVFIGFSISLILGLKLLNLSLNSDIAGIFAGGTLVVAFGLVDDKRGLSPSYKLLGQIIVALSFLIISHNIRILSGSGWDVLILILWMVGLMNAINFLDAMDGLCAGISFIAALAFLVIAVFNHQMFSLLVALALMGGLLGFLRYNWSPAKIFLGDAGSMFNGFILACLGIFFARGNTSYSSLLVPVLILSYPIFDISFVTLIRLREGRKIYIGDYNNSPRRIANLGMQNKKVVLWIYLICFLLGTLGVLVYFFFDSPAKMLIAVVVWLVLVIFGVHLQRNFVNVREKLAFIFCDIIMINVAFLFFFWAKFHSGLFHNQWAIPLSEYVAPVIWITIFWLNLFAILGVYEAPEDSTYKEGIKGIAKAIFLGIVIFLVLTLDPAYLHIKSWILLLIYSLILITALGMGRGLLTFLVRRFNFLRLAARKAIIVGTRQRAKDLLQTLSAHPEYGYQVVGLIHEGQEDSQSSELDFSMKTSGKVLGKIQDLDEVVRQHKIQDILIAVEPDWKGTIQKILDSVHNVEVFFKIIPDLDDQRRGYQTSPSRSKLFLRIFPSHMRSWEWLVKRFFDALISLLLLLIFLPIWATIAFMLAITFKANPLVRERYVGKMGRKLRLYKYRVAPHLSGSKDRPPKSHPCWLGRFLKNSGLDKVPALLNILKGEMSLVGPEPLRPETFESLSNTLPFLPKRLSVKPGLFNLARIRRRFKDYADMAKENLQDDLFYLENMSLLFDLRIIMGGAASFLKKRLI